MQVKIKTLFILIIAVILFMPGCKKNSAPGNGLKIEIVYASKNLDGHAVFFEPNPGGGTDCSFSAIDGDLVIHPDYGEIVSNPFQRNVWVNAIGVKQFIEKFPNEQDISLAIYRYYGEFRLPLLPVPDVNQVINPQSIHAMVQLWDGGNVLLNADNYSLEFSMYWDLNPWDAEYGMIKVYTGHDPIQLILTGIYLEPDTEWHSFEMFVDFKTLKWISLAIDGIEKDLGHVDVARVKHADWNNNKVLLNITTESLPAWPQFDCSRVFTWTTQFRNLEFCYCEEN